MSGKQSSPDPLPRYRGEERTLVLVKPDAVQRQLSGKVISRFVAAGLTVSRLAMHVPDRPLVRRHYRDTRGAPFYEDLVEYLAGEKVLVAVFVGEDAVAIGREVIGDSDPAQAAPGTVRGDFGTDSMAVADREGRAVRNVAHASDSREAAEREFSLWLGSEVGHRREKVPMIEGVPATE